MGFPLEGGDVNSLEASSAAFSSTMDFIRTVDEAAANPFALLPSSSFNTFGMSSLIFFVRNDAFVIMCLASWNQCD
jgi:hypothetical protein